MVSRVHPLRPPTRPHVTDPLAELKDLWDHRELSTREYRQMRKAVEDRIATLRRKTVVRPTVEVLADLVGPNARTSWD